MLSRFASRSRAVSTHAISSTFRSAVVVSVQQPITLACGAHAQSRGFSTAAHAEPMKTQTRHLKPLERTYSGSDAQGARTSMHLQVKDHAGALQDIVSLFAEHSVNMTYIESRPSKAAGSFEFFVDFEEISSASREQALVDALVAKCVAAEITNPKAVPWFPRKITDLDSFSQKTLDAGAELESDHPGFNDPDYRKRRAKIVENAAVYKYGQEIPRVEYTAAETEAWGMVYKKLGVLGKDFACKEYLAILPKLEETCGYGANNIPQLQDISMYLKQTTGFQLRPVAGLLSARDFLNALAFRTFFSTQYIRHPSEPFYTPEPDVCHELMGHVPMLADPDFAAFSHEIGLASLGASDADIKRLATCYWFSVEFGLCREGDALKAYGAGLLSSFGELEYACASYRPAGGTEDRPQILKWDPSVAAATTYPITTYQPTLFAADSLAHAKERMTAFCENEINRPFYVSYDQENRSVKVDRAVRRSDYTVVL